MIDQQTKKLILKAQKNEITEYYVYRKLSQKIKQNGNERILAEIAEDELGHYHFWEQYSGVKVGPSRFNILKYYIISRILGITFGIRLMEKGEKSAQKLYQEIAQVLPEANQVIKDEHRHEGALINLLNEERLKYVGSIVLGLNDALVELTGALAGLTFALQNAQLIAVTGLITGIAASFSMAASEYLSTKSENDGKEPLRASIYTGITYVITVLFLIAPYLIVKNIYLSLVWTIFNAIIVILLFTFYTSIAQNLPFKKRFLEMTIISLGIASLSFGVGWIVKIIFGVEV
ncbi:MAG: VIT1/CCC1 transporter family protein [Candidatus Buchananbacteria bacterium]|nr:VIT1/CCC1 transporter family protein [Candidatus Buchananbacteria bacterium]